MALVDRSLLSTGEAARACGVSTQTIVNWIAQGKLRAARTVGGRFRVHSDSLVAFLKTRGYGVPTSMSEAVVYVVDDDPAYRVAAKRTLSGIARVETFSDGYRGLLAVAARLPRLLVLDMKMPGCDGVSVLNALRADPSTQGLPIVVSTAYEEEAALAMRLGATAAVIKGSGLKLREVVARLLAATR